MLLFILRHGDPIYNPDSLTPRGKLQAAALGKRLAQHGIDEIYSSPLIRAQQTAEPTAILTGKPIRIEDWMSESKAWDDFAVPEKGQWFFQAYPIELHSRSMTDLGHRWYEHPLFNGYPVKRGYDRLLDASDDFLARLGYEHDRENCCYRAVSPSEKRVAAFCHQGFGLSWLGVLLDLPLPCTWGNMDMGHTGMTVIEFLPNAEGLCVPRMLTLSNDSHLYREGLPTQYHNRIYF